MLLQRQVPNENYKDKTDHWPLQIEDITQRWKFLNVTGIPDVFAQNAK